MYVRMYVCMVGPTCRALLRVARSEEWRRDSRDSVTAIMRAPISRIFLSVSCDNGNAIQSGT